MAASEGRVTRQGEHVDPAWIYRAVANGMLMYEGEELRRVMTDVSAQAPCEGHPHTTNQSALECTWRQQRVQRRHQAMRMLPHVWHEGACDATHQVLSERLVKRLRAVSPWALIAASLQGQYMEQYNAMWEHLNIAWKLGAQIELRAATHWVEALALGNRGSQSLPPVRAASIAEVARPVDGPCRLVQHAWEQVQDVHVMRLAHTTEDSLLAWQNSMRRRLLEADVLQLERLQQILQPSWTAEERSLHDTTRAHQPIMQPEYCLMSQLSLHS